MNYNLLELSTRFLNIINLNPSFEGRKGEIKCQLD